MKRLESSLFSLRLLRGHTCAVVWAWLACAAAAGSGPVMVGYFIEWGVYGRDYHAEDIPAHLLTHVNYAFVNPVYTASNDTARLDFFDEFAAVQQPYSNEVQSVPFRGNFNQLLKLKERYPHVKTLLSAGGWTLSDDFSDIAASSNARATFAESCADFVTTYGFDGIDLDWEYPVQGGESGLKHRPEDADNLLLLLARIREELDQQELNDGKDYLLTIAASAGYNTVTNRFRLPETADNLDWICVMAYGLGGPWDPVTTHEAPLYGNPAAPFPGFNADTGIQTFLSNGVPASKLVLGMPYYGQGFKSVPDVNNGLFQIHFGSVADGTWSADGIFDYKDLKHGTQGHQYINANGYTAYRDPISHAPYLYNAETNTFISYEDEVSVAEKAAYARDMSLAGVMCWSLNMDTTDGALQQALYRKMYPTAIVNPGSTLAPGLAISWQAWTNQTYVVEENALDSNTMWLPAQTMVDPLGTSTLVFTGQNSRAELYDTNSVSSQYRMYRITTHTPPF